MYIYYTYIFFPTVHIILKHTHLLPQQFCTTCDKHDIYMYVLTYIYIYSYIYTNLYVVFQQAMHLSGLTATADISQACSESGWCEFPAGNHCLEGKGSTCQCVFLQLTFPMLIVPLPT